MKIQIEAEVKVLPITQRPLLEALKELNQREATAEQMLLEVFKTMKDEVGI